MKSFPTQLPISHSIAVIGATDKEGKYRSRKKIIDMPDLGSIVSQFLPTCICLNANNFRWEELA